MPESPRCIVVTGPESCGKTTLAAALAHELAMPLVTEFAREYIDNLSRNYTEPDLPIIASGQVKKEKAAIESASGSVICDTDVLTIRIWQEFKYGRSSRQINEMMPDQHYRFYLLCAPDLPWRPDPQRENPRNRDELFGMHIELLERLGAKYSVIGGSGPARTEAALAVLGAVC
jgi:nicotinamide riboside kinase